MKPRTKVALWSAGGLLIALTPLFWLLGNPDMGQLVGASVQAATGAGALLLPFIQKPDSTGISVSGTGKAEAVGGGRAVTGLRDPGGTQSRGVTIKRTGDARADGTNSQATSGIDFGGYPRG